MNNSSQPSPRRFEQVSLFRLKQVLQFIPVCKTTWWNGVKSGRFPQPIRNGRCTFWKAEDIEQLIEDIANGKGGM